jgi:hypothetical protein
VKNVARASGGLYAPGMRAVRSIVKSTGRNLGALRDASKVKNVRVLWNLLGPAVRGFLEERGKSSELPTELRAHFNWSYADDHEEFKRLYSAAKRDQWDAERDVDWKISVDPDDASVELIHSRILPFNELRSFRTLSKKEQREHCHALITWMLSQFLHGEQGALFAACQLTEAIDWMNGKLYGSTQVVDEGRHVEVFKRYLQEKLGRIYVINDNLYVILDALMSDSRWDMKFLGMQIMVEGLALGAFGTMRQSTDEPLLREILRYVITDEARHVHFGVVALENHYTKELSASEVREREDWAFEMSLLMRNRFLAHELYDEYYAHIMSRRAWDEFIMNSELMRSYRNAMFRRIIPNLKKINLLSERIRPYYAELGVLHFEEAPAAPELTAEDMLEG